MPGRRTIEVATPGRGSGETDARDAAHLARLLRLGETTAVRVPNRGIEAVRDLVRAREDARADLMRVRHRLSKLLLRQGIVYSGGTPWTYAHEEWLRRHRFDAAVALRVGDRFFGRQCCSFCPRRLKVLFSQRVSRHMTITDYGCRSPIIGVGWVRLRSGVWSR